MLVDISHVSPQVMSDVLDTVSAPVIFSHSSARTLCSHPRNVRSPHLSLSLSLSLYLCISVCLSCCVSVSLLRYHSLSPLTLIFFPLLQVPDAILRRIPQNGGVVLVNFYPLFVSQKLYDYYLSVQNQSNGYDQLVAFSALKENRVDVTDIADHVVHIKNITGIDHVGFGSDFDGIGLVPDRLASVADCKMMGGREEKRREEAEEKAIET
jgi:membrane dipeptidase